MIMQFKSLYLDGFKVIKEISQTLSILSLKTINALEFAVNLYGCNLLFMQSTIFIGKKLPHSSGYSGIHIWLSATYSIDGLWHVYIHLLLLKSSICFNDNSVVHTFLGSYGPLFLFIEIAHTGIDEIKICTV